MRDTGPQERSNLSLTQIRLPPRHGRKESWEESGYKIFTNTEEVWGERMDLPGDLVNTDQYCATLGHKINHHFTYNCTEWFCRHPRHGLIPCITAVRDIQEVDKAIQSKYFYVLIRARNCSCTTATTPATAQPGTRSSSRSSCRRTLSSSWSRPQTPSDW